MHFSLIIIAENLFAILFRQFCNVFFVNVDKIKKQNLFENKVIPIFACKNLTTKSYLERMTMSEIRYLLCF